jgi:hypothetical protein
MIKWIRIRRRQFLVGTGLALAQTAMVGRSTQAGSSAPPPPPAPPVPVPVPPAANTLLPSPGVAPGYIISGRGQSLTNPYFHPLGGPSTTPRPRPPAANGDGVNENDQGQNQNNQGGNQQ